MTKPLTLTYTPDSKSERDPKTIAGSIEILLSLLDPSYPITITVEGHASSVDRHEDNGNPLV